VIDDITGKDCGCRDAAMGFEVPAELFSGNPNLFRIFRFNPTFTGRFFCKPPFIRILTQNLTLLGHGLHIPNIIGILREIHDLAANHRTD
jgi:hypothetical protein